jgi:hypothetical protein
VNLTVTHGLTSAATRSRPSGWFIYCTAWVALLSGFLPPFASPQGKPTALQVNIRENGYFRADLGLFFVEDGRLDVYDGALDSGIIWDNVLGNYTPLPEAEKQFSRSGAPYYHEAFQLERGEWNRTERNFAQKPSRFLDFGPCDTRNQLDLPDDDLAGLDSVTRGKLPHGAKVKGAAQSPDRLTVIVSSERPKEASSIYEPGTYQLRITLLSPLEKGWQVADNRQVEKYAYYCGMRTFPTKLQDGEPATVLLLYSSIPQGSRFVSACRQIRSFIIRHTASSGPTS